MEWWMIALGLLGLVGFILIAFIAVVFLEAAFRGWDQADLDGYDDADDLDALFRKRNYGD